MLVGWGGCGRGGVCLGCELVSWGRGEGGLGCAVFGFGLGDWVGMRVRERGREGKGGGQEVVDERITHSSI